MDGTSGLAPRSTGGGKLEGEKEALVEQARAPVNVACLALYVYGWYVMARTDWQTGRACVVMLAVHWRKPKIRIPLKGKWIAF